VLLDALPQIRAGLPADASLLLTVAGPAALHDALRARGADEGAALETYVAGVFVAAANAAFGAGADGIALIDAFDGDAPARIARARRTLRKLADFHGGSLVAFATSGTPDDAFDQGFELARGSGPIVAARPRDGHAPWHCTRADVPRDLDVAELKAMAARVAA
jgi:hypothetical protein